MLGATTMVAMALGAMVLGAMTIRAILRGAVVIVRFPRYGPTRIIFPPPLCLDQAFACLQMMEIAIGTNHATTMKAATMTLAATVRSPLRLFSHSVLSTLTCPRSVTNLTDDGSCDYDEDCDYDADCDYDVSCDCASLMICQFSPANMP